MSNDVAGPDGSALSEGLGLSRMEQLLAFCDWERKHNPHPDEKPHIAEWAAAEIERLKDAVRFARADEAHCWASRIDALTAQLREVDARYVALLKAVADGVAMQPRTVVLDLGPNAELRGRPARGGPAPTHCCAPGSEARK
jgi:hypothetical protein